MPDQFWREGERLHGCPVRPDSDFCLLTFALRAALYVDPVDRRRRSATRPRRPGTPAPCCGSRAPAARRRPSWPAATAPRSRGPGCRRAAARRRSRRSWARTRSRSRAAARPCRCASPTRATRRVPSRYVTPAHITQPATAPTVSRTRPPQPEAQPGAESGRQAGQDHDRQRLRVGPRVVLDVFVGWRVELQDAHEAAGQRHGRDHGTSGQPRAVGYNRARRARPIVHVSAIIAAGGRGSRVGAGSAQAAARDLAACPSCSAAWTRSCDHPLVTEVVVALPPEILAAPPPYLASTRKPVTLVEGGARRQDSVALAFARVSPARRRRGGARCRAADGLGRSDRAHRGGGRRARRGAGRRCGPPTP